MKASRKPSKPYWEMDAKELAAATREFDREIEPNDFHALGPEKQRIWERLRQGHGLKGLRLCTAADITALRGKITKAAGSLTQRLHEMADRNPVEVLKDFKLESLGFDPYDPDKKMNLVEQINQSATLLVACAAAARLLKKHPSRHGYVVSRPTTRGFDLWAVDASVAAEVFAATTPASNQKLKKDLKAVLKNKEPFALDPPQHRYIFFAYRTLKGLRALTGPEKDPILGDVWHLVEHGRRSVTVVPLAEETVFRA